MNQLKKVVDLTNSSQGFNDDSLGSLATDTSDDYSYDLDGNMTKDENKDITNIKYNHLNLPTEIVFTGGRKINYTYDATGIKLKKKVQFTSHISNRVTTDYLDGYQYETQPTNYGGRGYAQLLYFPTAEGYGKAVYGTDINNTQPVYQYVYNYTDHLGNIRMSYTLDQKTGFPVKLEETHYYPFGLKHGKYNDAKKKLSIIQDPALFGGKTVKAVSSTPQEIAYKYKYNSKEYQDELDLNWYDYGARNSDPAVIPFTTIDPRAEDYYSQSPYAFAANNPVYYVDINGEGVEDHYELDKKTKKLVKVKETDDDFDIIYAGRKDKNGKFIRNGKSIKVKDTNVLDRKKGDIDFSKTGLVFSSEGDFQNALDVTRFISIQTNTEVSGYGFKDVDGVGLFVNPWKNNKSSKAIDWAKIPNTEANKILNNLGEKFFQFHTHQKDFNKIQPSSTDWKNMKKRNIPSYIISRRKIWKYLYNSFGRKVVRKDRKLNRIK